MKIPGNLIRGLERAIAREEADEMDRAVVKFAPADAKSFVGMRPAAFD